MMQTIDGKRVYVVEFDTMPELPITGLIKEEAVYESALSRARGFIHGFFDPNFRKTGVYAEALNAAIETGVITEPGKYGIHIDTKTNCWNVFKIIEE
jgi:hypothetical protein